MVLKWDESSETDAVHAVPAAVAAASVATAALERNRRAETRKRPEWWEPRAKGASQHVLKLRPASSVPGRGRGTSGIEGGLHQDQGVEEMKGGEAGYMPGSWILLVAVASDVSLNETLLARIEPARECAGHALRLHLRLT